MIDTTSRDISQCIVQTTHGTFLPCGTVLYYCCLHICLLPCLPLFCKGTTFFRNMQILEQENDYLRHFSSFPISTHYVKVRFYGCFSAPQWHYDSIFAVAKLTKLANFRHNLLPFPCRVQLLYCFCFFFILTWLICIQKATTSFDIVAYKRYVAQVTSPLPLH